MDHNTNNKDNKNIEMEEHYMVEQSAPRWVSTVLSTIGAALTAGLLLWIASSQLEISTNQAFADSKHVLIFKEERHIVQWQLHVLKFDR